MHDSQTASALRTAPGPQGPHRAVHRDGAVNPGDLSAAVAVGRAADAFDSTLYGLVAVLVLPTLFAAAAVPGQGLWAALALLALAPLVRPLGSWAGQALQQRRGRGWQLTLATLGGAAASCLTGLLPLSAEPGALVLAGWLLCRLAQGLAQGAAWDALPAQLALQVPAVQRSRCERLGQLGAPVGMALAVALVAGLHLALGADEFLAWGWRFPFMVALAIHGVALFGRLQLTLDDEAHGAQPPAEFRLCTPAELLHPRAGLLQLAAATGLSLAGPALAVLALVLPLAWAGLQAPASLPGLLPWLLPAAALAAAGVALAGPLTRQLGERPALAALLAATGLVGLVSPWLLDGGASGQRMFMGLGGALAGAVLALTGPVVLPLFSLHRRHAGTVLAAGLAGALAALLPLAVLAATGWLGAAAPALVLVGTAALGWVALRLPPPTATQPGQGRLWWLKLDLA